MCLPCLFFPVYLFIFLAGRGAGLRRLVRGERRCHGPLMRFLPTGASQPGLGMAGVPPFPSLPSRGRRVNEAPGGLMSLGEPGRGTEQPPAGPATAAPLFPIVTLAGSFKKAPKRYEYKAFSTQHFWGWWGLNQHVNNEEESVKKNK